ncbi:hypothetical protein Syun_020774 [Stephania yunnanensis]|uniref:Pentatricopeptide repeat-containing protein n=1 Tax=Stephania yunnanensis TaxID=152371 RepID=A0AAP0NNJ4_9MAGN
MSSLPLCLHNKANPLIACSLYAHCQTTLVDGYSRICVLDHVCQVFDKMPKRDVASWNALIDGLAQESRSRDGLGLFKKMRVEGVRAN